MSRPLTTQEVTEILSNFTGKQELRNVTVFFCQIFIGSRISDILSLRIQDVYHKKMRKKLVYTERKTGKKNSTPITGKLKEVLQEWIDYRINYCRASGKSFLFTSNRGGALSYDAYQYALKRAAEAAGLSWVPGEIGTHGCRKWFGNYIIEQELKNGEDFVNAAQTVRKLYNHKSLGATTCYLGKDQDKEEQVRTQLLEGFSV